MKKIFSCLVFLISLKAFAFDASNWMRDLYPYIKDKPLNKITLPGTHDSATDKINAFSPIAKGQDIPDWLIDLGPLVSPIIAGWSKAQNLSIYSQLLLGVRYLDLRITHNDEEQTHYTVHGMYGQKVSEVILEIKQFMDEYPNEVVILTIGNLRNMVVNGHDTNEDLIKQFYSVFKDNYISTIYRPKTLLKDIPNNKRLIIFYYNDDFVGKSLGEVPEDFLWNKKDIRGSWANTDNIDNLWPFLKIESEKWLKESPDQFFNIAATLTPNKETFIAALNPLSPPNTPKNLNDLANLVKPKININDIEEMFFEGKRSIITIDMAEKDQIEQMILLNQR